MASREQILVVFNKLAGAKPNVEKLVFLLERRGFLCTALTGVFDYEVRIEIINRLGEIGDLSAVSVLSRHSEAYWRVSKGPNRLPSDKGNALVAEAADRALSAINDRFKGVKIHSKNIPKVPDKLHIEYMIGDSDAFYKHKEVELDFKLTQNGEISPSIVGEFIKKLSDDEMNKEAE